MAIPSVPPPGGNALCNVPIEATFTDDIDPTSLTPLNFTLTGPEGMIPALVEYLPGTRTARLTPNSFSSEVYLQMDATYTAVVGPGIRSAGGAPLESVVSWYFKVTSCDTHAPDLSGFVVDARVNSESEITLRWDPGKINDFGQTPPDQFSYAVYVSVTSLGQDYTLPTKFTGRGINEIKIRPLYPNQTYYFVLEVRDLAYPLPGHATRAPEVSATTRSNGRLYVANSTGNNILFYPAVGDVIKAPGTTVTRTLFTDSTGLTAPGEVAVDPNTLTLYVGDFGSNRLALYDLAATGFAGGDLAPQRVITSGISSPAQMVLDSARDELFVVNVGNGTQPAGNIVVFRGLSANPPPSAPALTITSVNFFSPIGIAIDRRRSRLYVINRDQRSTVGNNTGDKIFDFDLTLVDPVPAGTTSLDLTPGRVLQGPATLLSGPTRLALDEANDRLFVANRAAKSGSSGNVLVFDNISDLSRGQSPSHVVCGPDLVRPSGIFLGAGGTRLYVTDADRDAIVAYAVDYAVDDVLAQQGTGCTADQPQQGTPLFTIQGLGTLLEGPLGLWERVEPFTSESTLIVANSADGSGSQVLAFRLPANLPSPQASLDLPPTWIISPTLVHPYGLALDLAKDSENDILYVSSLGTNTIVAYRGVHGIAGNVQPTVDEANRVYVIGGPNTGLSGPLGLFLDDQDPFCRCLYVANVGDNSVLVFDTSRFSLTGPAGAPQNVAPTVIRDNSLFSPIAVAVDTDPGTGPRKIYVANRDRDTKQDNLGDKIVVFNGDGTLYQVFGGCKTAPGGCSRTGLEGPAGLAVIPPVPECLEIGRKAKPTGLYIANRTSSRIVVYDDIEGAMNAPVDVVPRSISGPPDDRLVGPAGLYLDPDADRLYVTNNYGGSLYLLLNASTLVPSVVNFPAGPGGFRNPFGIAFDPTR